MTSWTYQTIAQAVTAEYKDRGSRFLGFGYPIQHLDDVKKIQNTLQKQHFKSVHVCYAYRLGMNPGLYRVNDDQEPAGTAGLPILGQIDSYAVTDIVIMVVRYFGGTLLGVPGLIKAYKTTAKNVLMQAEIIEKPCYQKVEIRCGYAEMHEVLRTLKHFQAQILTQLLELDCYWIVNIPLANYENFLNQIKPIYTVQIGEIA